MVTPFIFLRGSDESHNAALARCAAEVLARGTMSFTERRAEHEAFLEQTLGKGRQLLWDIHVGPGTECAVFVGACAIAAGVVPKHGWPKAFGITTWTGLGGFGSRCWIPYVGGSLRAKDPATGTLVAVPFASGDVPYWCGGTAKTWPAAFNGHVEILEVGSGHFWTTAAGGGGADGTKCAMTGPKDIRESWARPLRGVWRPDRLVSVTNGPSPVSDTDPAPPPTSRPPTPINRRKLVMTVPPMRGPDVAECRWLLGLPDGDTYDTETERAVRAFQSTHGLTIDGVVGSIQTWPALLKGRP